MATDPAHSALRQLRRLFSKPQADQCADRSLVRQFIDQRDAQAFAALTHRHGPMVLGVCQSVLRNTDDAHDAFQATFLVLARKASAIRKQESVASWLHGVAYRVARKARILSAKRHGKLEEYARRPRIAVDLTGPLDDLTWRELRGILHEELDRLADRHRQPLVLCYLEGKTVDEAGQQLGWPSSTVKGRLDQARKILRFRLARRGLELSVPLFATLLTQPDAAAALPTTLVEPLIAGAANSAAHGAGLSSPVIALAQGVITTMFWTKLKFGVAATCAAATLIALAGWAIAWTVAGPDDAKLPPQKLSPRVPPSTQVAAAEPLPKKEEPAGPKNVQVTGQIVDDETGVPVPFSMTQGGRYEKEKGKITWGYWMNRSSRPDPKGTLNTNIGWGDGWRARVIAPGYAPQPILDKTPTQDKVEITLRMKKGRKVTGTILDHAGKPATGTAVFVVGGRPVAITGGRAIYHGAPMEDDEDLNVTKTITDERGFFSIAGIGEDLNRLAVSGPAIDLWVVPIPEKDNDFTIRLPQPGKLTMRYDIDGASADAAILLQMETYKMPGWEQVESLLSPKLKVKDQIVLPNLPPGNYQLTRSKSVSVGGMGNGSYLDRRVVTIKPGETVASDFVREKGCIVTGQVLGLDKLDVDQGAFIYVKPPKSTGDYRKVDEGMINYDATSCGLDGKFKTERLAPGEYTLTVQAYAPEVAGQGFRSGLRAPLFPELQKL